MTTPLWLNRPDKPLSEPERRPPDLLFETYFYFIRFGEMIGQVFWAAALMNRMSYV